MSDTNEQQLRNIYGCKGCGCFIEKEPHLPECPTTPIPDARLREMLTRVSPHTVWSHIEIHPIINELLRVRSNPTQSGSGLPPLDVTEDDAISGEKIWMQTCAVYDNGSEKIDGEEIYGMAGENLGPRLACRERQLLSAQSALREAEQRLADTKEELSTVEFQYKTYQNVVTEKAFELGLGPGTDAPHDWKNVRAEEAEQRVEKAEKERDGAKRAARVAVQITACAICDEQKHTPVRNDDLGGYICGGCLEKAYQEAEAMSAIGEKALTEISNMRPLFEGDYFTAFSAAVQIAKERLATLKAYQGER